MEKRRNKNTKKAGRSRAGKVLSILLVLAILATGGYFAARHFLFGAGSSAVAYVQEVSTILGYGNLGTATRYSGVVQAKDVVTVNPDSGLTVAECFVKAGDAVKEGEPLFRYDVNQLTVDYEQLLIDIMGLENTISASTDQIARLEKKLAKARESKKYELKLELSTVQLEKKKSEFELEDKLASAEQLKQAIDNSVVVSPCTGKVKKVNSGSASDPFAYNDGDSTDYITIISGSDFCVKGTVNEQTIRTLYEGMPVTIRSRTDESRTYVGSIYRVNTEETEAQNNFFYDGGGESASKYAFYVALDSLEDLILGQHVYIETGMPAESTAALCLPAYYLTEDACVYAKDAQGLLEKRPVSLGTYDPDLDAYEILSGLTLADSIAFPEESLILGARCETILYAESGSMDAGFDMGDPGDALPEIQIMQ